MQPPGQASWLCSRIRRARNTGADSRRRSHARSSLRRFSMPRQSGTLVATGWLALLFNMRGAHRLRSVFEEGGARNRAYLAERIANMEIKGLVTLRLKPS